MDYDLRKEMDHSEYYKAKIKENETGKKYTMEDLMADRKEKRNMKIHTAVCVFTFFLTSIGFILILEKFGIENKWLTAFISVFGIGALKIYEIKLIEDYLPETE